METFAAAFAALYAAHHVGDYWIQTDHQARHKGDAGRRGALNCLAHVGTYTLTQALFLLMIMPLGDGFRPSGMIAALLVSAVTHYAADRREHGIMLRLARLLPGKAAFLRLGVPRGHEISDAHLRVPLDNPSLGTGAWALDQSWHVALGVFAPALLLAVVS